MARDDRQRHQRRAQEDLDKGLKRGDVNLACAGLLGLPVEMRVQSLAPVGRLLRREANELFGRRQWPALRILGARFDQEAGLLSADANDDDVAQIRWALLWAAWHTGQLEDAQRRLQLLSLPASVLQALTALIAGTLTPELCPPGDDDDRSPNEPIARARPSLPQSVAEVEEVLLDLSVRSFSALAAAVREWLPRAPAEIAAELRRLGCDLALRELLLRGKGSTDPVAEPAVFISELSIDEDPSMARAAVIALRLLAQASSRGPTSALPPETSASSGQIVDRGIAQALLTLAVTVARQPAQRTLAVQLVEGLRFHKDLAAVAIPGLEALLDLQPTIGLWSEALRLWVVRSHAGTTPPAWLVTALGALLNDDAIGRFFTGPDHRGLRSSTLDLMVDVMPVALVERVLEQAFAVANEEGRSIVAGALNSLLDRVRTESTSPPGGWKSMVQRQTFLELLDAVEADDVKSSSILDEDPQAEILNNAREYGLTPAQAAELEILVDKHAKQTVRVPQEWALWARWAPRMIPLHPRFLARALIDVTTADEACATTLLHLRQRNDVTSWYRGLEVLIDADAKAGTAFGAAFVPLLVVQLRDDVSALARALVLARRAPRPLRLEIARALLALPRQGSDSDEVRHAVGVAGRLLAPMPAEPLPLPSVDRAPDGSRPR